MTSRLAHGRRYASRRRVRELRPLPETLGRSPGPLPRFLDFFPVPRSSGGERRQSRTSSVVKVVAFAPDEVDGRARAERAHAPCAPGTILCDDFEAYPAGIAPDGDWTAGTKEGGDIVVDDERAFSGANSIHLPGVLNGDGAHNIARIEQSGPCCLRALHDRTLRLSGRRTAR